MTIDSLKIKVTPMYPARDMAKMVEDGDVVPEPAMLIPKFKLKVELNGDLEDMRTIAEFIRAKGKATAKEERALTS